MRDHSEIERILAAKPKSSVATLPSPSLPRCYSVAHQAKVAGALAWKSVDPRLPSVIAQLEDATVYLPLDRSGPQGEILRKIGKLGIRIVVLLGDLSVENRGAIGAREAEPVIVGLKNRALAGAPLRGRAKTRDGLRDFIECAARIWQSTKNERPTCSSSKAGRYEGAFLEFVIASLTPFVRIHRESLGKTVQETLRAIRRAGSK